MSGIDATLRAYMFGEYPKAAYYQYITFEDFVEAGQKIVMQIDDEGFTTTTTAAIIDLYELFKKPTDANDMEFSTIGSATRTKNLLSSNTYDMIFLQSGRYHTLREKEKYDGNITSAIKLCKLATEKNPNVVATVLLPTACRTESPICSPHPPTWARQPPMQSTLSLSTKKPMQW